MISKRDVTQPQVEEWCRRSGFKLCKTWPIECKCIWVEPCILQDRNGNDIVDCSKCAPQCEKCGKQYHGLDRMIQKGVCVDCKINKKVKTKKVKVKPSQKQSQKPSLKKGNVYVPDFEGLMEELEI